MVITIAGGGSTFTAGIVKSIALRREELEVDEIRLFDINKERQDKVAVVVDWVLHKELNTDIKLVVTTDVQQAYTDTSLCLPRCAWAATPCGSRTKKSLCATAAWDRRPAAAAAWPTECAPSSP